MHLRTNAVEEDAVRHTLRVAASLDSMMIVEPQILGGPKGLLLGNTINDQLTTISAPHFAASLSILLLIGISLVVGLLYGLQTIARRAA